MFRWVPSSLRRFKHILVLLVVSQTVWNPQDAFAPFELLLNCPITADTQNENEENEREETELLEALFSQAFSLRQNLSHRTVGPTAGPGIDHCRLCFVSFDPARDHIASGAGIYQRC